MSIKEQVRKDEYEVDADAVAKAIVRRLAAFSRRVRRSDEMLVAAKAPGSPRESHA